MKGMNKMAQQAKSAPSSFLPTAPTPKKVRLEDQNILLYGPPKIGKSSFAAQLDMPIFAATEDGLHGLEVYQKPIVDWLTFLQFCAEITKGEHPFKNIVIDTADNLFKYCSQHMRAKLGIMHESDMEWGKGWSIVKDEFMRVITKLASLPYGLFLISHAEIKEIKTRTEKYDKWMPTMPKQGWEVIYPFLDIILFANVEETDEGEQRVVRTRAGKYWEAGCRFAVPEVMPLDFNQFKAQFEEAVKHE